MIEKKGGFVKAAVTGGPASGKSLVCQGLAQKGMAVIDADALARAVVRPDGPAYAGILAYFGKPVLLPDGRLNRPRLREIILSDPRARQSLEALIHPAVAAQMEQAMEAARGEGKPAVFAEVPLLFEAGLAERFDTVVAVRVDPDIRIARLIERDQVSPRSARKLIAAQWPDEKKAACADFVIDNNGSRSELMEAVDRFYQLFFQKYIQFF